MTLAKIDFSIVKGAVAQWESTDFEMQSRRFESPKLYFVLVLYFRPIIRGGSMSNLVFIACSIDGYIADRNDGLDWLQMIPNPDNLDMGWEKLNNRIDAIIMGRNTFETVLSFNVPWPYDHPVFVLSNSMTSLPEEYKDKAEIINGDSKEILEIMHQKGFSNLYIDGGVTVQNFLKEDLIDEMIITTIPILLGEGTPLFGGLPTELTFEHIKTEVFLDTIVQNHYIRKKYS